MKDIEIEIQGQIEHSEKLKKFLSKKAKFISEKQQIDEYFTPTHRNFLDTKPIQEWLRLRSEGDSFSMNYKKWHYDDKGIGQYADEYETPIENIETARKIFAAIDLKPIVKVDKTRKKWLADDFEIAMDSVVGLGDFIEIEYKGKDGADPEVIRTKMITFLKEHECGQIVLNNGGYPYQLLFPEEIQKQKIIIE